MIAKYKLIVDEIEKDILDGKYNKIGIMVLVERQYVKQSVYYPAKGTYIKYRGVEYL